MKLIQIPNSTLNSYHWSEWENSQLPFIRIKNNVTALLEQLREIGSKENQIFLFNLPLTPHTYHAYIQRHPDEKLNSENVAYFRDNNKIPLDWSHEIILSRIQLHSQSKNGKSDLAKAQEKTYKSIYEARNWWKKKEKILCVCEGGEVEKKAKIYQIKRCYLYRFWSKSHFNDD